MLTALTAGGNDVGFVRDLYLMASRNSSTWSGWLVRKLWGGPPTLANLGFSKLSATLAALIQEIYRRLPRARIVVATYPAVLPQSGTCPQLQLTTAEAEIMRQVQAELAAVTDRISRQGGATVVDMTESGENHSACSATPWTKGWGAIGQSPFHPNITGAQATADAIAAALRKVGKRLIAGMR
jgi:lysophospholipase L1-like esterase